MGQEAGNDRFARLAGGQKSSRVLTAIRALLSRGHERAEGRQSSSPKEQSEDDHYGVNVHSQCRSAECICLPGSECGTRRESLLVRVCHVRPRKPIPVGTAGPMKETMPMMQSAIVLLLSAGAVFAVTTASAPDSHLFIDLYLLGK